ncbi:hypothetical protein AcV5_007754 [Taiwanofungus camphoratus]|nr:hypothetical protein AcV5_007754 [Antrodia cinnamomea]
MRSDDRNTFRLFRLIHGQRSTQSSSLVREYKKDLTSDAKCMSNAERGLVSGARPWTFRPLVGTALRLTLAIVCLIILAPTFHYDLWEYSIKQSTSLERSDVDGTSDVCPQTSPITPLAHSALLTKLEEEYTTEKFRLIAYESLGGAVRIPTVAYDDLRPPGHDPRWEIFGELHKYLTERFPLIHVKLRKTEVNIYALVYHWQGTDNALKPILLTAHQDVVPVEPRTVDEWINPPFSGYYDGEWIWGRGSCDDKPGLIGSLTAVEKLLEQGFQPTRTIVLAYGIDEERSGISGATAIRDYLLATYGEYAFSILVDEGGGYKVGDLAIMASPAVAEKGSLNVRMEISTPGGHSSVPPLHTSIGMLASIIQELEANPHPYSLKRDSTYYQALQCQAEHDPALHDGLRKLIKKSFRSNKALKALEVQLAHTDRMFKPSTGTTQAIDIIHGGVKTNALPENVFTIINHRIDVHSSVAALQTRIASIVGPVAQSFHLSVDAFGKPYGETEKDTVFGHLQISDAFGTALEPAPVSPMTGSGPYELLSGTIIGSLGSSNRTGYSQKAFVAPGLAIGNTGEMAIKVDCHWVYLRPSCRHQALLEADETHLPLRPCKSS